MMLTKTVFGITLVLVLSCKGTYQQFAGCREHHFLKDGSCIRCPGQCADCISELNCTTCRDNYYGPVCQQDCPGCRECHKEYGYCTYGCQDGYHPIQDSGECPTCPENCKLCKSRTECAECLPGYYGNVCEIRCPNCERCDKTTGRCRVCAEGHFNQDGQCHDCHENCVSCYGEKNCSRCKDDYFLIYNGQCIMDCSMEGAEAEQKRACLNHGGHPHGSIISCQSKTPCIQYNACSSNIICSSRYDEKSSCGTIDTYQCSHLCYMEKERKECSSNCTIRQQTTSVISFCLTNQAAFSIIKLEPHLECSDVSEVPSDSMSQQSSTCWEAIIPLILVLILLGVAILYIIRMKRRTRQYKQKKESRRGDGYTVETKPMVTVHT